MRKERSLLAMESFACRLLVLGTTLQLQHSRLSKHASKSSMKSSRPRGTIIPEISDSFQT